MEPCMKHIANHSNPSNGCIVAAIETIRKWRQIYTQNATQKKKNRFETCLLLQIFYEPSLRLSEMCAL